MPKSVRLLISFAGLVALALGGCGKSSAPEKVDDDPALTRALAAPIMIDPELFSRNNGGDAIAGGGPPVMEMPPFEQGAAAITMAKAEAEKLVGGQIVTAPAATEGYDPVLRNAVTASQRARSIKGPGTDCGSKADYAMAWSLRLPDTFAIYPRGHLLEAAGSDRDGCRLRVVRFVTPVEPVDVINFYYTRARRPTVRHLEKEAAHVLSGSSGTGAFAVQARKREDGMTEVDVVVNGV